MMSDDAAEVKGEGAERADAAASSSGSESGSAAAAARAGGRGKREAGGATGRSGGGYPTSVQRLIDEFGKLPGIGPRSAERMAFHVIKSGAREAKALAEAITDLKRRVLQCSVCFSVAEEDPCAICADAGRNRSVVMVVEQPRDVMAVEQTGMFRGVYHVLMGRISPLEGIGPEHVTIRELVERVTGSRGAAGDEAGAEHRGEVKEVILALNPTLEGDGTALYVAKALAAAGVNVTRLSRGLATGTSLEFATKSALADAIEERRPVG